MQIHLQEEKLGSDDKGDPAFLPYITHSRENNQGAPNDALVARDRAENRERKINEQINK